MSIRRTKLVGIVIGVVIVLIIGGAIWVLNNPTFQAYPNKMRPVWDVAYNIQTGDQNTRFATEINQVGFYTFLHGKGPFTVFVPSDKAYSNLPVNDQDLFNTDQGSLRQTLLYNIVKGRYHLSDLQDGMTLHTIEGDDITVHKKGESWALNGYSYLTTEINSTNGVIFMTTNYLIPPSLIH